MDIWGWSFGGFNTLMAMGEGRPVFRCGTADDNVHLRNAMEMSEALVQANKQFEMQIYTNRNHSIYGGNTRRHLLTRLCNFLDAKMK